MAAALMSGMANVLMLTGSFFMLQVYDRILPSRSVPTLVGLAILAAALFVFLAAIDSTRARLMARIGNYLDGALSGRAYQAGLRISVVDRPVAHCPAVISIKSDRFCRAPVRSPSSICPGCRFTPRYASCFIPGSGTRSCSARCW